MAANAALVITTILCVAAFVALPMQMFARGWKVWPRVLIIVLAYTAVIVPPSVAAAFLPEQPSSAANVIWAAALLGILISLQPYLARGAEFGLPLFRLFFVDLLVHVFKVDLVDFWGKQLYRAAIALPGVGATVALGAGGVRLAVAATAGGLVSLALWLLAPQKWRDALALLRAGLGGGRRAASPLPPIGAATSGAMGAAGEDPATAVPARTRYEPNYRSQIRTLEKAFADDFWSLAYVRATLVSPVVIGLAVIFSIATVVAYVVAPPLKDVGGTFSAPVYGLLTTAAVWRLILGPKGLLVGLFSEEEGSAEPDADGAAAR